MPQRARLLLILLLLPFAIVAHADPNVGIVARYGFETLDNGRIPDLSGKGNDLMAQGKLTLAPGKVGQAVVIGKEGYPQAAFSPSLELGGEMTLEAWIKPDLNPPSGMRILDRATIGGNDGFMFDTWPEGHLRLIIGPGLLRDSDQLPAGEWTHVVATYSAELCETRLYRNGQIAAETTAGGKLNPSQWPLNLGASQGGGDRFIGLMDEVRIYNRALAPEEIMAHFQGKEIEPPLLTKQALPPLRAFVKADKAQVDYAAQCARNDLVYLSPAKYPFEAMRMGNGNLCATVWNEGGMSFQLNNGNWRHGNEPLSSGKITLSTPALSQEAPATFSQRLRLLDGTITTAVEGAAGRAEATSFMAEGEDCFVFRCTETSTGPRTVELHLWPSRKDAHFVQGPDYIAITEHANNADALLTTDMALVVKVTGPAVKVGQKDERTLTLTFDQPGAYTIYAANPLLRGDEKQALQAGLDMISRLQAKDYNKLLAERQAYWHSFWPRSFVNFASRNGEAEFMENLWYQYMWDMASQSRGTLCPKFNGGNFLVFEDMRHWGGGYWHQNTREIVWPLYSANHVDLTEPFFQLYGRAAKVARESGRGMGVDGYFIPEWIPVVPSVTIRPIKPPGGYTAFIFTVATEVALQAMWRYEFSGDNQWLRDYAYPLLKGSLDFYLSYAKKGPDGKYHLDPADAQESYWLVRDPAQDLAALRWGIPVALQVSKQLGVDADMRPRWQDLLDNLAPFPVDADKHMIREADLKPTDERHNTENVANYATYPFAVFGIGKPDWQLAKNTFDNRPVQGMGNGWEPAAIVAARLGLADEAAKLTMGHMISNLRAVSGTWYSPTTAVFAGNIPDSTYYDAAGVSAQGLNEMLLQSHDGIIRLAPAWPAKWQAQYRLLARGGFMVSADIEDGRVRYALIESQRGGACRVANPWPGKALVSSGGKAVLSTDKRELVFPTKAGKTYRLEPAARPLAKLAFAPLAPKPNAGPKYIGRLQTYPKWTSPAYLGIDEKGQTPQRANMLRTVQAFAQKQSEVTKGLTDLTTGLATATPGAPLVDGKFGEAATIPNEGYATLDLGAPKTISAVAFSRDRTALFVDSPVVGYTIEVSADGQQWQLVLDRQKNSAPPAGEVVSFPPTNARHLRLRVWGAYGRSVELDELTVYGPK